MSDKPSLLWGLAAIVPVPYTPTVATGEIHSSLLDHHSSNTACCYIGLQSIIVIIFTLEVLA
jgi:hypothetical protein